MPKLKLSFPHFRPAGFCGMQMGEARRGQICHAQNEATRKPNITPFSSERSQLLPSANSGHEFEMTNSELRFADSTPLDITSLISVKLIIEMDGSQHLEQEEYDNERTKYLESLDYKVIRFWNNEVTNNMDGVILAIIHAMEDETDKE